MPETLPLSPGLSPNEEEELGHIAYLLNELKALKDGGVIGDMAYQTIFRRYVRRGDEIRTHAGRLAAPTTVSPASPKTLVPPIRSTGWSPPDASGVSGPLGPPALPIIAHGTTVIGPSVSVPPAPQGPNWTALAADFLKEHWQKVILCLGALLILVSSTVGAVHVLGPMLWSPEGKCILALVYTGMFGGLGYGLSRWGARSASATILLGTLLVMPVVFSLAAGIHLESGLTPIRGLVVLLDVAGLAALASAIPAALNRIEARPFALWYLAISLGAAFPAGSGIGWFYRFISFLLAMRSLVRWIDLKESDVQTAWATVGLFGYAFLLGAVRDRLDLPATLNALPIMAVAIAAVRTAHSLQRRDTDQHRVSLLRWTGYTLSLVSLALAVARPPEMSALYSGNTLATGLVGLALFAVSLSLYRQPAYLYLAFGTLALSWAGAGYFVREPLVVVENLVRQLIGFHHPLPFPFKAMDGVVFNLALAGLAIFFQRRWRDRRLALHCHYIGLPLAMGSCAFSTFDPRAATICLGVYAAVFGLAAWIFEDPRLVYLSCGALAAGGGFLMSLGASPLAAQGFALVVLGFCFRTAAMATPGRCYRVPLLHSSLAAGLLGLPVAAAAAIDGPSWMAAVAFLADAGLFTWLIAGEMEAWDAPMAHLAAASKLGGWLCIPALLNHPLTNLASVAVVIVVYAVALLGAAEVTRSLGESHIGRMPFVRIQPSTLPDAALVCFFGAISLALIYGSNSPGLILTLALSSMGLLWGTRFRRDALLVYSSGITFAGAVLALVSWNADWSSEFSAAGVLALACGIVAVGFWLAGFGALRMSCPQFYTIPIFRLVPALTGLSVLLTTVVVVQSPGPFQAPVGALLVDSLAFLLLVWRFPAPGWLYGAIGSAAWAIYLLAFTGPPGARQVMACTAGAFLLWIPGFSVQRYGSALSSRLGFSGLGYDLPWFKCAVVSCAMALALRVGGTLEGQAAWDSHPELTVALAVFCLLMVRAYASRFWVHLFVSLVTLAVGQTAGLLGLQPSGWLVVALLVANGWYLASRGLEAIEPLLCQRLGVESDGYARVARDWGLGAFAIGIVRAAGFVVAEVLQLVSFAAPLSTRADWVPVLLALGLAALGIVQFRKNLSPDGFWSSLHALGLLAIWWVGIPSSPLVAATGWFPVVYLPVATALFALVLASCGAFSRGSWPRNEAIVALLAVALTRCDISWTTVFTLFLVSSSLGVAAGASRMIPAVYGSAVAFVGAWVFGAIVLVGPTPIAGAMAAGAATASLLLLLVTFALDRAREETYVREAIRAVEQVACGGSILAAVLLLVALLTSPYSMILVVLTLVMLAVFYVVLGSRWKFEWPLYAGQVCLVVGYLVFRSGWSFGAGLDACILIAFCFLDFALGELLEQQDLQFYAGPALRFSILMPVVPLGMMLTRGQIDSTSLMSVLAIAAFYGLAAHLKEWREAGYASAVLCNVLVWMLWAHAGWKLAEMPQFYVIPVGLSAILFAQVNRKELGGARVHAIRSGGLVSIYLSTAVPLWQYQSFSAWLVLLVLSLAGLLIGIGLRIQSFFWLGLASFVFDVVYQVGRMGAENALAKWAVMLGLGLGLILFAALNEKQSIASRLRQYYETVRGWE